jgi:hypothetical protein
MEWASETTTARAASDLRETWQRRTKNFGSRGESWTANRSDRCAAGVLTVQAEETIIAS